ncbi:MAG TPA: DoxX family protein [Mucilaginibacter sp.]|nr:DoxX family protein [Mucilaginibacter sp.]
MKTSEISKAQLWTGRILGWLVVLFMLMDGIMKILKPRFVVEATVKLGYAEHHVVAIGVCATLAAFLYVIPRTQVLGAILLTAHFGGAIASNFRLDMPLVGYTLFPVYLGVIMWGSLWLRNENLRRVFPLSR